MVNWLLSNYWTFNTFWFSQHMLTLYSQRKFRTLVAWSCLVSNSYSRFSASTFVPSREARSSTKTEHPSSWIVQTILVVLALKLRCRKLGHRTLWADHRYVLSSESNVSCRARRPFNRMGIHSPQFQVFKTHRWANTIHQSDSSVDINNPWHRRGRYQISMLHYPSSSLAAGLWIDYRCVL